MRQTISLNLEAADTLSSEEEALGMEFLVACLSGNDEEFHRLMTNPKMAILFAKGVLKLEEVHGEEYD